jgi:outer membrane usher protein
MSIRAETLTCIALALIGWGMRTKNARAEGAKPRVQGASLVAPLLVDKSKEDTAWIFPNKDPAKFFIEAETLLSVTRRYLPAKTQAALEASVTAEQVISVKMLEEHGIHVKFDEAALDMKLTIPPSMRARNEIDLRPRLGGAKNAIGPAPYSGYLNLRATQGFQFADQAQGGNEKLPTVANLQLINNFHGWVAETGADYQESNTRSIRRSDTRIVKDDESHVMRYTVGDLQLDTSGFQSVQSLGGFSATRNFAINPYETTRPVNRTQVFLKRPSTVEVYVNGLFVQRLQLPAGPFNLQDYPLAVGRNDVQLRVTDDLGQIETIDLSVLFDNQLLRKGLQQFSYNFGFVSTPTQLDREYDTSNFLASAFHRVGVTDRLTLGANVQRDRIRSMLGLEAYWATWLGMLTADLATSRDSSVIHGNAGRLRYQSLERWGAKEANTLLTADAEYDGQDFSAPGSTSPSNVYAWKLDSYLTERLPWQLRAGAGYQYYVSRTESPNRAVTQFDLSKNWSPTLQTGLNYSITSDAFTEHRVFASLSWSDSVHQNNVQSTYDSAQSASRVDWFRQPEKPYDDVRLNAAVQHDLEKDEVDARADYVGQRAELTLDHRSVVPTQQTPVHQTSLSLGTALVWTDQSAAISRPVTESFVIIHDPASTGVKVAVNENGNYSEATVNSFGPGVLPSLVSYYEQPITLGVTTLPEGYSLGREFQLAKPTYKSGVDITLKIHSAAVAVGEILLPDGSPISLQSGDVVRVADPEFPKQIAGAFVGNFFTNQKGRYFIENLEPGSYELRFYDPRWKPLRFKIKQGQVGMIHMAPMILEAQP